MKTIEEPVIRWYHWVIVLLIFIVAVLVGIQIGRFAAAQVRLVDYKGFENPALPGAQMYYWFQWNGYEWVRTGEEIFLTKDQIPYPNDEEHVGQCLIRYDALYRYPGSEALTAERICGRGSIPTPTPQPDKYLFLRFQKSVNESWFFTGKVVLSENFPEPNKDACYINFAAFLKHPDISANDLATSLCN